MAIVALSSGGGYALTATFDQVNGLVEGADVQAGGLKVGSVERIDLGENELPEVRMRIDDGFRIHRGGRANIRFFSVSGEVNRYVALEQGSGPQLADGAALPGTRTDQPVEIDQVLSTLDPARGATSVRCSAGWTRPRTVAARTSSRPCASVRGRCARPLR